MASVLYPRWRAKDSDNNPLVGATLTVYLAGTTTLADIWHDAGLSSAMTNPTTGADKSDAGGWFPQFFADEGLLLDILIKDSNAAIVETLEDVPSLGSDTGDLTRTVTGDGRYRVIGSAGIVITEYGDPSPDDVGGTSTERGWNGTQGTVKTFDFAEVNAGTSAGALKENSKKIPSVVYTEATSFSSSAGVVIPLPNSPSGVRAWKIYIWDFQAAATTALTGVLSYDGGVTYKSGASDYNYTKMRADNAAGPGTAVAVGGAVSAMELLFGVRTAANRGGVFELTVITPDSGSEQTIVLLRGLMLDNASATYMGIAETVAAGVGGYGRATHLKIQQGANLLTGKYRIEPLRGFGET